MPENVRCTTELTVHNTAIKVTATLYHVLLWVVINLTKNTVLPFEADTQYRQ